jgi:predicted metal-dependent hydrolase
MTTPTPSTLTDPRGRSKAYRPMAPAGRAAALASFVRAYEAGEFYEAHELLEPAWMGASVQGERELLSGLIKLAAAFVHAKRGNAPGIVKNLRGARERLANAVGAATEFDVGRLIAQVDERLALLDAGARSVEPVALERR